MTDIPEIPTIEENPITSESSVLDLNNASENLTGGLSENSEETEEIVNNEEEPEAPKEDALEGEGAPTDGEIEVGYGRAENIDEDMENILNNPQDPTNNYLIEQLREPEAQKNPEVGKEQLLKISKINQQIKEEGDEAKEDIAEILGLDSKNLDKEEVIEKEVIDENKENLVEEVDKPGETTPSEEAIEREEKEVDEEENPETEETPEQQEERIKNEIIGSIRKLLDEELSQKTNEILEQLGMSEMTQEVTSKQLDEFMKGLGQRLDKLNPMDKALIMGNLTMLEKLPGEEKDKFKEVLKILLKIAIKASAKLVSTIARNIAKANKDDKATQAILGSFADLTDWGAEAITGKGDIHNDIVEVINKIIA